MYCCSCVPSGRIVHTVCLASSGQHRVNAITFESDHVGSASRTPFGLIFTWFPPLALMRQIRPELTNARRTPFGPHAGAVWFRELVETLTGLPPCATSIT